MSLATEIEAALQAAGSPERAEGEKRYLKSDLHFFGVDVPTGRRIVRRAAKGRDPQVLLAAVVPLWTKGVFECRRAAVELLIASVDQLGPADLPMLEQLLRECRTWALVDELAPRVVGPLVERHPEVGGALDRWAGDPDFWIRRSALLALLLPLRAGGGDWDRFTRYADALLEDKEFFIRKAIGWVLREAGKKTPERVHAWLLPRAKRAAGLTVREAVKRLPDDLKAEVLAAR